MIDGDSPGAAAAAPIGHVFVYGTLLPGDVRFHLMAPFVVDEGWPDWIAGRLYDTGLDYPAAVLDRTAGAPRGHRTGADAGARTGDDHGVAGDDADGVAGDAHGAVADDEGESEGRIVGRTFSLVEASAEAALALLDEVEGVVDGAYRRVAVTTGAGVRAWVYEFGSGPELVPIPSGDWLAHRPAERALPLTRPN